MAASDPLDTLRRRAYRHTLEDGLADILVGFYTLTVAVATQNRGLIGLAVAYLLGYAAFWKFVHPTLASRRIGYAEVRDPPPQMLLVVTLASMVMTMTVVAAITWSSGGLWNVGQWPKWSPVLAGLVLAGGFLYTGRKSGLLRYYVYTGTTLGGSLFFWLFPFGSRINASDRLTLFLFAIAAVTVLTGGAVLIRFTRTRPIVDQEEALDGR